MIFANRAHAGRVLANRLGRFAGRSDAIVLALPRGGVPVGYEVARRLHLPLDVFVVRKLGVPGHRELAMGAIADGVRVLNRDVLDHLGLSEDELEQATRAELVELTRREQLYRAGKPRLDVAGKTVILVDDGLATGSTMRAAARALRLLDPAEIVIAVPVASREACAELARDADELVCATTPAVFQAVGLWYQDFAQTTDEEVSALLESADADDQRSALEPR